MKDFLSYCRLVKGTVASAGKIKGLRGAKLGNPYLRWAFGEAAVIAKRDHTLIGPLAKCHRQDYFLSEKLAEIRSMKPGNAATFCGPS